jgi:hypothetical protein
MARYNLLMNVGRPAAPYPPLPAANTALSAINPLRTAAFPVDLERHHIIPDNKLRSFWNRMVTNNHLMSAASAYLYTFIDKVGTYSNLTIIPADIDDVKTLLGEIRAGTSTHDASQPAPGNRIVNFSSIFSYLPGNIMLGPIHGGGENQRDDDPGEAFEATAQVVTGPDRFARLRDANAKIDTYLTSNKSADAQGACAELLEVVKRTSYYDLSVTKDAWKRKVNGRYQLKAA